MDNLEILELEDLKANLLMVLNRDYEIKPEDIETLQFRLVDRAFRMDKPSEGLNPVYVIKTEFICYTKGEEE
jgi:hypothetical protein